MLVGGDGELARRVVQCIDAGGVVRGGGGGLRERRHQRGRSLRERLQLGRLVVGNEALQRDRARHLRQGREPGGAVARRLQRRRQHADVLGAGLRRVLQRQQRRHRFGLRVFQVQRVEIETQLRQQRRPGEDGQQRHQQHRLAVALQEQVRRGQPGKAGRLGFAAGAQHADQRRQQRERGGERDDHAGAGDQAQLGHAAVIGRQEAEERRRGGGSGQRQRRADRVRGHSQRLDHVVAVMALGAVAHAELDAEVHAEADKQHRERHRDHVQRAHHGQPQRRGDQQPGEQACQHGHDQPRRAQRQPQDQHHHQHGQRAVERGAVADRGKFIVGQRLRAGQPHRRLVALRQLQVGGRLPDRARRRGAGLQVAVVEHRAHGDVAVGMAVRAGLEAVVDQSGPRQRRGLAGQHLVQCLRAAAEQLRHVAKPDLAHLQRQRQRGGEGIREAAQRGVVRQRANQRARLHELLRQLADFAGTGEQQSVVREKRSPARLADGGEARRLPAQRLGQRLGGGIGQLRRGRLDHRQDQLAALREGGADGVGALCPRRVRFEQAADVGIDRKVARHVDAAGRAQHCRQHDDPPGPGRGEPDDACQQRSQHGRIRKEHEPRVYRLAAWRMRHAACGGGVGQECSAILAAHLPTALANRTCQPRLPAMRHRRGHTVLPARDP
ncbi:hypothetical protein D9M68_496870 [compost metagenome]